MNERERDARFYDAVHREPGEYAKPYRESVYFSLWTAVAEAVEGAAVSTLLDLGCGSGAFAELIRDRGQVPRYHGVDFSPVAIETARRRCPTSTFTIWNVFDAPDLLEQLPYDGITAIEVLEHVEHDLALLGRVRAGTWVVLAVPSFDARGHVRWFPTADDVVARYDPCLVQTTLRIIPCGGGARFYLLAGRRGV